MYDDEVKEEEREDAEAPLNLTEEDLGEEVAVPEVAEEIVDGVYVDEEEKEDDELDLAFDPDDESF